MSFKTVLSVLTGIMAVLAFEQMLQKPLAALYIGGVFFVVIMGLVAIIVRGTLTHWADAHRLILPALYLATVTVVVAIAQSPLTQQVTAIAGGVGLAALLYFVAIKDRESFARPFTLATAFTLFYALLGLDFYLTPRVWLTMVAVLVGAIVLAYQSFARIRDVLPVRAGVYAIVVGLIVGESLWALTFWPTQFFVASIVLTVVFYTAWGLAYSYFRKTLNRRVVGRYIAVSVIALFLVLSTAQWIAH